MKAKKVKPEVPSGFRDYYPQDMIKRNKILHILQNVSERFGFDPIETPHVEKLDVLTGNDPDLQMYLFNATVARGGILNTERINSDMQENPWALRFDHTVPLARFIAANLNLPKPFKRYAYGSVFRGESPQAGRFREFKQFDIDIVGAKEVLADAEVVSFIYEVLTALEVKDFLIKINNRKVLNGLADVLGVTSNQGRVKEIFRLLDKLDKSPWEIIAQELAHKPDNYFDNNAPDLSVEQINLIEQFTHIQGDSLSVLNQAESLINKSVVGQKGIEELSQINSFLKKLKIPIDSWKFDLSVARGLGYYTGPVFETILLDKPNFGSIFSGGRYDDLVNRFVKDVNIPATGASIGFDRFYAAIDSTEKKKRETVTELMFTVLDSTLLDEIFQITTSFRRVGINTEIYFGDEKSLKGQIIRAAKKGIPFIAIYGPDEKNNNTVVVKDLTERKEYKMNLNQAYLEITSIVKPKNKNITGRIYE